MQEKNKKIIIGIILILIIIVLIILLSNKSKRKTNNQINNNNVNTTQIGSYETTQDSSEVFYLDNVNESGYNIVKANAKISPTYNIYNSNIYELQLNVKLNEQIGKMIYVRNGDKKLNIFQTEYKIDEYDDEYIVTDNAINEFEMMSTSYIGVELDYEREGTRWGTSELGRELPLSESIYDEEMVYTKKYTYQRDTDEELENMIIPEVIKGTEEEQEYIKDYRELIEEEKKEYEINIYKAGEGRIVAELVYIIE